MVMTGWVKSLSCSVRTTAYSACCQGVAGVERVDAAGNCRELHPLVHRRGARRPLRLAESKRSARSNRPFAPGRAVAVTVTSDSDPCVPNDLGPAGDVALICDQRVHGMSLSWVIYGGAGGSLALPLAPTRSMG